MEIRSAGHNVAERFRLGPGWARCRTTGTTMITMHFLGNSKVFRSFYATNWGCEHQQQQMISIFRCSQCQKINVVCSMLTVGGTPLTWTIIIFQFQHKASYNTKSTDPEPTKKSIQKNAWKMRVEQRERKAKRPTQRNPNIAIGKRKLVIFVHYILANGFAS